MVISSGIPELRRFCHAVVASAKLLKAKHFIISSVPKLLDAAETWARWSLDNRPVHTEPEHVLISGFLDGCLKDISYCFANLV